MKPTAHYEMLRKLYMDQPNEISLETATVCNARCTFCPYPTLERVGNLMSDEMIDELVGQMATFKESFLFSPFKLNDPFLDKRVLPLCKRINEEVPLAYIRIFTNGSPLTPKAISEVAKLKKLVHLWVSLNEYRPDEYEKLMGLNFEQTTRKLDYLHEQVVSGDFPHPVMLSCVGYPNEPFRKYCFDRWPQFESMAIMKTSWLGFTDGQIYQVPDTPCARWFELSIMSDGVVSLCCQDSEGKFPLGDLKKNTMLEVYNQPELRKQREQLVSRRSVPTCNTCSY